MTKRITHLLVALLVCLGKALRNWETHLVSFLKTLFISITLFVFFFLNIQNLRE